MAKTRGFLLAGQAAAVVLAVAALMTTAASPGSRGAKQDGREADRLNGEGVSAYDAGDYSGAGDLFNRALDLDPGNATIRGNLALAVFAQAVAMVTKQGDVVYDESALSLMEMARGFDPDRAEIRAALGKMYFLGSRYPEARVELEQAVRLVPDDAQSIFLLGEIEHREGDVAAAVERWRRAAELDPSDALTRARLDQAEREDDVEHRFARRDHRHFTLHYDVDPAGIGSAADEMLRVLEDAYAHIGRQLDILPGGTISVVVYEEDDFRNITGLHDWARGVYDGRIRVPYAALRTGVGPMRQVFFHEYTHAAIFHVARGRCPVWLNEGLAQLMSGEWDGDDAGFLADALAAGELEAIAALERPFVDEADPARVRTMYAESYVAARYLFERYGRFAMAQALRSLGAGHSMSAVLGEVYGIGYDELDLEVRHRIEWGDYRL